jgi:hypothetical protein
MNATEPIVDNGERRIGIERRQFSYSFHLPERRSGKDRRGKSVRMSEPNHSEDVADS